METQEKSFTLTARSIRASGSKEIHTDLGSLTFQTARNTTDSGKKGSTTERESTPQKMALNTMASGKLESFMELEPSCGQTGQSIKASGATARSLAVVNLQAKRELYTLESGSTANTTVAASCKCLMARPMQALSKTASSSDDCNR